MKILNKNVNITNPVNIKLLNTKIENTKPPIKRLNIIITKLETPNTDASWNNMLIAYIKVYTSPFF